MCVNCGNTQNPYAVYNVQYVYKNECTDCGNSGCEQTLRAGCVFYTSANLLNSGVVTNDSLEVALQKIDTQLAAVTGNYAGYNMQCLAAPGTVTTEAQFVSLISGYVCNLRNEFNTFTGNTFTAYQTSVDTRFLALEKPGVVHAATGLLATDTLAQSLSKLALAHDAQEAKLSLAGVNWSQCFAVGSVPTTIAEGFSLLADQICQIKGGSGSITLPVFNNVGSVLATPGAADTLEATVIKLRDRVNLVPTFNINTLAWNAITKPSSTQIDLQSAFQAVLARIDTLAANMPVFDGGDFSLTPADGSNPYAGKNVALSQSLNIDRFVALDSGDTTPGTLLNKLQAGAGVEFDTVSVPGKLVLKATALGGGDYKVKAASTDDAPGFLDTKLKGNATTAHVSTSVSYDAGDKKAQVTAQLDIPGIANAILALAETDSVLKARLCAILATCPNPCAAPQNVQVVAV
jgi:hypothetical protein